MNPIETKEFIDNNKELILLLQTVIDKSIKNKKAVFLIEDYQNDFLELSPFQLVTEIIPGSFSINYKSFIVCQVLLEIAEKTINQTLPTDLFQALEFAEKFCLEIRQPKPNSHWYHELEMDFKVYILIYLNHIFDIDVSAFIFSLTEESKNNNRELWNYEMRYSYAFPYLNDSIEKTYNVIVHLLSIESSVSYAIRSLTAIGELNPTKAENLYYYAIENDGISVEHFLPNLLIGLFTHDENRYYEEIIKLFHLKPFEGIKALAYANYTDSEIIKKAFGTIESSTRNEIQYLRVLPAFYTRLIENKNTPKELIDLCFDSIRTLCKIEDEQLRDSIIFSVRMIEGFDDKKFLLYQDLVKWANVIQLSRYFNKFKSSSYLFKLIREAYIYNGMNTDFEYFKDGISSFYLRNFEDFENELLKLLTDDLSVVRFGAVQIMTRSYNGIYNIDFLKLSEEGQLKVIETLLPIPYNIEELIVPIIKLLHSPYISVQVNLVAGLKELVWAYDYHIIELLKSNLNIDDNKEGALFKFINDEYLQHKMEKDLKQSMNEFNPFLNDLEMVDLYYRLERESHAEMMEKVSGESAFAEFAKNISVVRGGAFKSEANDKLTPMQRFASTKLIDQRYFINPDSYDWEFKFGILGKNYKQASE